MVSVVSMASVVSAQPVSALVPVSLPKGGDLPEPVPAVESPELTAVFPGYVTSILRCHMMQQHLEMMLDLPWASARPTSDLAEKI